MLGKPKVGKQALNIKLKTQFGEELENKQVETNKTTSTKSELIKKNDNSKIC